MKLLLAASLAALSLSVAVPASAQGVYVGPGGVGVDTGIRDGRGYRDRDPYVGRRPTYEGRSVYRHRERDRDRD